MNNSLLGLAVSTADATIVRISVRGEVDMASAPQLLDALLSASIVHSFHTIVADLTGVSLLDSSGIGALLIADARIRDSGSRLVIVNPQPIVARVLEVTGLDRHFDIRPTWLSSVA